MTTIERGAGADRVPSPSEPATAGRAVLVIIGPSGGGKSTVVRTLARRQVLRVHPTYTTRPRRTDEAHGSAEHRFLSERQFDHLARRGFFADTVSLFGLAYRYGLPPLRTAAEGPIDTVMLRAPLVARFPAVVPAHVVYQIEDRPERVIARLASRNSSNDDLDARMRDNQREVEAGRRIAHRVFRNNGSLAELVAAITAALRSDIGPAPKRRGAHR
ncbi:MAG: hypothetical protein KY439_11755 [Actinobacteria bacterium]|nr:hypothetical protein [Actinomycetota bacterium]